MPRPRPERLRVTLHSQAASARAIIAAEISATPRGPASCASTQTSQAAAAYMGKARNCLKVSIQAPGLGMKANKRGQKPSSRNGKAKPNPSAINTARADSALWVKAKPNAAAMNAAVQGAATATARPPAKNAP